MNKKRNFYRANADYPDACRNEIGIEFLKHVSTSWMEG